ncbi:uncharacterized protein FFB20_14440 [Fusarium fujikuroi]|nr:uncharacterized protein Y057_7595 [Fusarium fujikuroi]KLP21985.1 uncharacterized protein LW94_7133 [Fusarium fujikuroi]SCO14062.1 uncharacterized protein FFB20_14440 [Fusarium fujikuroi]SCO20653.1 uncharacterized protein FFC1_13795 [Fusarium fujikuroi]SCO45483.1 uncharacterized protein FFNC_10314 [Fusarium fujikuroi]
MLKNKKRRDMSRTQDALLRQPETLPVALIVSERIKRANCPRKRRARSSRRMRSDVCFPSRTSTKVFCCIDQGPPKMHSYSLASIRHDEVDSLEDPTSYDGALDVDSSHQPEAALHEIMEKEKVYRHDRRSSRPRVALNATGALQCLQVHSATQTSPEASSIAIQSLIHDTELQIAADDIPFNQLYTRPESPPFDDSFAATRFHLGHLSHHHHTRTEISVQYETSPSTKPAKFTPHACPLPAFSTTANRGTHDSDVNSLLLHLRFNLRSPNLLTIAIDPAMNSQVADGMQQALLMRSATLVSPNATILSTRPSLYKTTLLNGGPSMILAALVEAPHHPANRL